MRRLQFVVPVLALVLVPGGQSLGQASSKYDFRGAWIATVVNLDWPSSPTTSVDRQKDELRRQLDSLKAAGLNAVLLQVRAEADALYDTDRAPWSYWLTGEQGRAPEPFYDPLRFAVEEAHARGLELHAWLNPFRARRAASSYERASDHVTREQPDWLLEFDDGFQLLNPGMPEVRDHLTSLIVEVARRYDVDGIHFDDYFYPYPPNEMDQDGNRDKDRDAFEADPRGFDDIENWRRDNINRFVRRVHDSLATSAPNVAFGISPFGIWKDGVPSGITGLGAYHTLYTDATAWLAAGTIDYLTPQLYWPFGGQQDYGNLVAWWTEQAASSDRHLYPGLAAYKSPLSKVASPKAAPPNVPTASQRMAAQLGKADFPPGEVLRQVRLNQDRADVQGSLLFRTEHVSGTLADSLRDAPYARPALPPPLPDRPSAAPDAPKNLTVERDGDAVSLTWEVPPDSVPGARRFAVYRVQADAPPAFDEAPSDADALLAVTGAPTLTDRPTVAPSPYHYAVTAVGPNAEESAPSASVTVEGTARPDVEAFTLKGNAPNPFTDRTAIQMALPQTAEVTLDLYDTLGRRVRRQRTSLPPGANRAVPVDGTTLAAGVYLYHLTVTFDDGEQVTADGRMVIVK